MFVGDLEEEKKKKKKEKEKNIQASYVLDVGISNINSCLNEYDYTSYRNYNERKYLCGCRELPFN
jgi:hypothetical protein